MQLFLLEWRTEFLTNGVMGIGNEEGRVSYLLAEDLLDEGRVLGDAVDDLRGGGLLGVEEAHLLSQDGLQVQVPDPQHLPLARPAPAVPFCTPEINRSPNRSTSKPVDRLAIV